MCSILKRPTHRGGEIGTQSYNAGVWIDVEGHGVRVLIGRGRVGEASVVAGVDVYGPDPCDGRSDGRVARHTDECRVEI